MHVELNTKVGDLVLARPETMRYLESQGVDFCCGGHRTLKEACEAAERQPGEVLATLSELKPLAAGTPSPKTWMEATLTDLLAHIEATHHAYLRTELPRLGALAEKVFSVHGEKHPELEKTLDLFQSLSADIMPHLMKEEQILFPFIRQMEAGHSGGACFASVQSPIRVMESEHEAVGGLLAGLRQATHAYTTPADGCGSFRALYEGLRTLEEDLHMHIYLENQILHPRALAMEADATA